MDDRELPELCGTVERVVFRNPDNGWTVLEVSSEEQLHTVVGVLPAVAVGEEIRARGTWIEHATFGVQFKAEQCERRLPSDASAILRYLSSGAVKGIGPGRALKIVRKFGDDSLRVLQEEPERLAEISGITAAAARQMGDAFAEQFGLREAMLVLSEYGLNPTECLKCYKKWGAAAADKIKENPYILCDNALGVSFDRVDALCEERQFAADDPRRVKAALLHVLRHNTHNGHTCLPTDKLCEVTAGLLQIPRETVIDGLNALISSGKVVISTLRGQVFAFLPELFVQEKYIAKDVRERVEGTPLYVADTDALIEAIERTDGIVYETEQRLAIETALKRQIFILTGGPGTGKTTTLKAILTALEAQGETVLLAAPTGRAAKRMSELTGREAKTVHRLLEVQWTEDDRPVFARDELNPLDADTVIVDELSMVDAALFCSLLRALKPHCRLVLVGDSHQLPAIGAGNVLGDLVASGLVPAVELKRVFRQALESHIVQNAHRIVAGEPPLAGDKESDFFFMKRDSAAAVSHAVVDLCSRRLPEKYGESVFDGIQVLAPARKGRVGTEELNKALQEKCNPPSATKAEFTSGFRTFRVGDKVMQTKNNYDLSWTKPDGAVGAGVFNGDIGVLTEVDRRDDCLTVTFDDDREVTYLRADAEDLELAYATTVHKSQGNEFNIVVIPLFDVPKPLCYRHLLYTAVTRAKNLLVIVGEDETLWRMIENNRKTLRYSGLQEFLTARDEDGAV